MRGIEVSELQQSYVLRSQLVEKYTTAYQQYCWSVDSIADIKIAPFHFLASENIVHINQTHSWHMDTLAVLCRADPELLLATPHQTARLDSVEESNAIVDWWETLTSAGGEGMVVKPMEFVARGSRGLLQPAIKSRGQEYLRIICGPEYSRPEYLARLRERGLSGKRSLVLREFALGIEALERFVIHEVLQTLPYSRAHVQILPDWDDLKHPRATEEEAIGQRARAVVQSMKYHDYEYEATPLPLAQSEYLDVTDIFGTAVRAVIPFVPMSEDDSTLDRLEEEPILRSPSFGMEISMESKLLDGNVLSDHPHYPTVKNILMKTNP